MPKGKPTQKEMIEFFEELRKDSYVISKSNDLIQKTRYKLPLQQQRIILYGISMIKPEDTELKDLTFDIKDFCDTCRITYNGNNFRHLRKAVEDLAKQVFWIDDENGNSVLCHWISNVIIPKGDTKITIRFDEYLKPHLIQLKERFTALEKCMIRMKSSHSARLYEILRSYKNLRVVRLSIDEIKKSMYIENEYNEYKYFKRDIIDKSIKEINELTSLYIEYEEIKQYRKTTEIVFTIKHFTENPKFQENPFEEAKKYIPDKYKEE